MFLREPSLYFPFPVLCNFQSLPLFPCRAYTEASAFLVQLQLPGFRGLKSPGLGNRDFHAMRLKLVEPIREPPLFFRQNRTYFPFQEIGACQFKSSSIRSKSSSEKNSISILPLFFDFLICTFVPKRSLNSDCFSSINKSFFFSFVSRGTSSFSRCTKFSSWRTFIFSFTTFSAVSKISFFALNPSKVRPWPIVNFLSEIIWRTGSGKANKRTWFAICGRLFPSLKASCS